MSSEVAIRVENLGKRYKIGARKRHNTLRDAIASYARKAASGKGTSLLPFASCPSPHGDFVWALKDVSFEVAQGEVVGIIGRNGAGKSTLLKILSRITEPTEGYAELRGRVGSLLEVGTGFHPELTGRENIFLNGSILGMRRQEIAAKLDDIVAFAEIEQFIDTPVKRYSSGMYVRLAFAVAAHLEPEILVIDEVLAVGDAEFQKKCLGKMGDFGREGRSVLLVSHNMPSILNLCQMAFLLEDGRIVAGGEPRAVVERYLHMARATGGEVVWVDPATAPGNDLVRMHAVRVLQGDSPSADVDISKDTVVEISFWNLRDGVPLYPALWLKDHVGTVVLSSTNHRSVSLTPDPWNGREFPRGFFHARCRIPADFLNEGIYSITAIVGRGVEDTQVKLDDVVSFHVHDTGGMRKEFLGGWVGTVRPRLAWHTEQGKAMEPLVRPADSPPPLGK